MSEPNYDYLLSDNNFLDFHSQFNIASNSGWYTVTYSVLNSVGALNSFDFIQNGNIVSDYYDPNINSALAMYSANFGLSISAQISAVIDLIALAPSAVHDDYSVYYGDVANVVLSNVSNGGAIGFFSQGAGSFESENIGGATWGPDEDLLAGSFGATYAALFGDIMLNSDYFSAEWSQPVVQGGKLFYTLLHEFGHALGLDHPGILDFVRDNQQYTIMSYDLIDGMNFRPSGLQRDDIAAIQSIYGANYTVRTENNKYGLGAGFSSNPADAFIYTIWDGYGVDTIDASAYYYAARIDLRQGQFSSIGVDSSSNAAEDNVAIAYYAVIENAIGTAAENEIIGNAWSNVIYGGGADDIIYGDSDSYGDDEFKDDDTRNPGIVRPGASAAADGSGNDILLGGTGNDAIWGGAGNDILHGGYIKSQIDTAAIERSGLQATVLWDSAGHFTRGTNNVTDVTGNDGNDILDGGVGNDWIFGGDGNDTLYGGANNDVLYNGAGDDSVYGGAGDDSIVGSTGSDLINGGDDFDTLDYSGLIGGGIVVNYSNATSATIQKGAGSTDTVSEVEKIIGTNFQDTFIGSDENDALYGSGTDILRGEDGDDVLYADGTSVQAHGGDGVDALDYSLATPGISLTGDTTGGSWSSGVITGIETIIGSTGNDNFTGTGGNDTLYGGKGNDVLNAHGGHDYLGGGEDGDSYHINSGDVATVTDAGLRGIDIVNIDLTGISYACMQVERSGDQLQIRVYSGRFESIGDGNYEFEYGSPLITLDINAADIEYVRFNDGTTFKATDFASGNYRPATHNDYYSYNLITDLRGDMVHQTELEAYNNPAYDIQYVTGGGATDGVVLDQRIYQSALSANLVDHEILHEFVAGAPVVATNYGATSVSFQTAAKSLQLVSGITATDLRFTYGNNGINDASLIIHVDRLDLHVEVFGFQQGINTYGTVQESIEDEDFLGFNSAVVDNGWVNLHALYASGYTLPSGSAAATHILKLESLILASGQQIDLRNGLPVTGSTYADDLFGMTGVTNTIYGMGGNDVIRGGWGTDDTIYGGDGDDTITVPTVANVVIYGDAGNDTITGQHGNETIFGGIGDDSIDTGGGINIVDGGDGNDIIRAIASDEEDSNTVYAGQGNDVIYASTAVVHADNGNDTITFYGGDNTIYAGNGDDTIYTSHTDIETNTVYGDAGADYIALGNGFVTVFGGDGDDAIVKQNSTTSGAGILNGGNGNDTISTGVSYGVTGLTLDYTFVGSSGNDVFNAAGNYSDTYLFSEGFGGSGGLTTINDYNDDPSNANTIYIDGGLTASNTYFWADHAGLWLQLDEDGHDKVLVNNHGDTSRLDRAISEIVFNSGGSIDLIAGVTMRHTSDAGTIYGSDGNDTIYGGGGFDVLTGRAGNDTLILGNDGGYIDEGLELAGLHDGNDTLIGGNGADTLDGGTGNNLYYGGLGNDEYRISSVSDEINFVQDTGGFDTLLINVSHNSLEFSRIGEDLIITFDGNPQAAVTIVGQYAADGQSQVERVIASAGIPVEIDLTTVSTEAPFARKDALTVNSGVLMPFNLFSNNGYGEDIDPNGDTISALPVIYPKTELGNYVEILANGTLKFEARHGFVGQEAIYYTITDGNGNEDTTVALVEVTAPGDSIIGDTQMQEVLGGTPDNDWISSLSGDDTIYADAGDDTVFGGWGRDTIYGEAGDDVLYGGQDIGNTFNGGNGVDTVAYYENATISQLSHVSLGVYGVVTSLPTYGAPISDFTDVIEFVENIKFGDQVFNLDELGIAVGGHIKINQIWHNATVEEEVIYGSWESDSFIGTFSNDTLYGYAGDDIAVYGGGEEAYIISRTASDTYSIEHNGKTDILHGVERVELNGDAYRLSDFNLIVGGASQTIAPPQSLTLYGTAADDTLSGDVLDDVMYASEGNDTYIGDLGDDTVVYSDDTRRYDILRTGSDEYLVYATGKIDVLAGMENITVGNTTYNLATLGLEIHGDFYSIAEPDVTLYGTSGNDTLQGGSGLDTFYASNGSDTFIGKDGQDRVVYSDVSFEYQIARTGLESYTVSYDGKVDHLEGIDLLSIGFGSMIYIHGLGLEVGGAAHVISPPEGITLNGTNGNDYLYGTQGADLIYGNGGDFDQIYSYAGNDTIYTGGGAASNVFGGDGHDTIYLQSLNYNNVQGDGGNDTIIGLGGYNYIKGGDGKDYIAGGNAGGSLIGDADNDLIIGGDGNDMIWGDVGDGTLRPSDGHDTLMGGAGDDYLDGGDGHDTLVGGAGADSLHGGLGDDLYHFDNFTDALGDAISDQGGIDTIRINDIEFSELSIWNADGKIYIGLASDAGQNLYVWSYYGSEIEYLVTYAGHTYDLINMTVVDVGNLAPTAQNDNIIGAYPVVMGNVLVNNGNGVDSDADNDTLSVTAGTFTTTQGYSVTISANGDFTYTTTEGFLGSDSFQYTVADGWWTDTATVSLTVNAPAGAIVGTSANNILNGANVVNDVIFGLAGNDTLRGYSGADTLYGGDGNDIYILDDASDTVYENASAGTDSVQSAVSYELTANVENLTLTGTFAINATGNTLNNSLIGNAGANILDGGAGNDYMAGGTGNDIYIIDNVGDILVEGSTGGVDTVRSSVSWTLANYFEHLELTGSAAIDGIGNTLANTIIGNSAANLINGMTSADTMMGGAGDDIYIVDNVGDIVTEEADYGIDVVQSSVTYILGDHVEHLTLTGAAAINATGNDLNNILVGNTGANILDGGSGSDTLVGGTGNDTYIIDDVGDIIVENAASGTDAVRSSLSYVLGDNLENLTLTGTAAINATGNSLNNALVGNAGDNTLDGGAGNDAMSGGAGNDIYIVDSASDTVTEAANAGIDTIYASVTEVLANNVENLVLTGTAAINGTGNTLVNILIGNSAVNTLSGGTGADTMSGGAGNDIYIVDNIGDILVELEDEGVDHVQSSVTYTLSDHIEAITLTGTTAINAIGNALDNTLTGNAGINTLDGGLGADTMSGAAGADIYIVDNSDDVIIETGADIDNVLSSVSYSLGASVENLTLTGSGNINATGNALVNTLVGNSGNNILDGGAGNDNMSGGLGDDTYMVDSVSDVLTEAASAGTDTVITSVTRTLAVNFENLILTGTVAINGTGNAAGNTIIGNSANNTLYGMAEHDVLDGGDGNDLIYGDAVSAVATDGNDVLKGGNGADRLFGGGGADFLWGGDGADTMTGGTGADVFVFEGANAFNNVDIIADFNTSQGDIIDITSLLTGYDPLTSVITDYVLIETSGSNSTLKVDRDGAGTEYGFAQIVTLNGVTGLTDEEMLVSNGNLLVA